MRAHTHTHTEAHTHTHSCPHTHTHTHTDAHTHTHTHGCSHTHPWMLTHTHVTFPPLRGLGGFPALTTLAGPVGSVETQQRWPPSKHNNSAPRMHCTHLALTNKGVPAHRGRHRRSRRHDKHGRFPQPMLSHETTDMTKRFLLRFCQVILGA